MSKDKQQQTGWACPKCGRVYAPWVDKCQSCGNSTITYTPPTCPCYKWWCTPYYTTAITADLSTLGNIDNQIAPDTTLNNKVKC